jgi:hypothetical protein
VSNSSSSVDKRQPATKHPALSRRPKMATLLGKIRQPEVDQQVLNVMCNHLTPTKIQGCNYAISTVIISNTNFFRTFP